MRRCSLKTVFHLVIALLMLAAFSIQAFHTAWTTGQTIDESFYNGSAYAMVRYNNYYFLGEHPPLVMQLAALPLLFIQPAFPIENPVFIGNSSGIDVARTGIKFLYEMGNDPQIILFLERSMIVLLAIFLAAAVYMWSRRLWGMPGALTALFLFSFAPNILAHASLFTTDMGLTSFFFMAVFSHWLYFQRRTFRWALIAGIFCGCALVSKASSLVLIPLSILLLAVDCVNHKPAQASDGSRFILFLAAAHLFMAASSKVMLLIMAPMAMLAIQVSKTSFFSGRRLKPGFIRLVLAGLWSSALIMSLWLFRIYPVKIAGAGLAWVLSSGTVLVLIGRFSSEKIIFAVRSFLIIWLTAATFVVLDYTDFLGNLLNYEPYAHYIRMFNIASSHALGEHMRCVEGSFISCGWLYFPGVMAVKTPALTLLLAFSGFIMLIVSRQSLLNKCHILLPIFLFTAFAVFVNRINIGLRHILPVYPFLFLLAGFAVSRIASLRNQYVRSMAMGILFISFAAYGARTLSFSPDYLSYFNEWVGETAEGAALVTDSNIDWGQNNKRLAQVMRENGIPHVHLGIPMPNKDLLAYYGASFSPMTESHFTAAPPPPGYYAIGIETFVRAGKNGGAWFSGRKPDFKAGRTIYVFKVD